MLRKAEWPFCRLRLHNNNRNTPNHFSESLRGTGKSIAFLFLIALTPRVGEKGKINKVHQAFLIMLCVRKVARDYAKHFTLYLIH